MKTRKSEIIVVLSCDRKLFPEISILHKATKTKMAEMTYPDSLINQQNIVIKKY